MEFPRDEEVEVVGESVQCSKKTCNERWDCKMKDLDGNDIQEPEFTAVNIREGHAEIMNNVGRDELYASWSEDSVGACFKIFKPITKSPWFSKELICRKVSESLAILLQSKRR